MGGRAFFSVLLFVFVAAPGVPAFAQDPSPDDIRARTHFEAGRSHFEEGAYDRARDEFQRAYDLSRRPALLLNLATTHERLGNYEQAIASIREYLSRVPDDESRGTLERRVENLDRLRRERGGGQPAPAGGGASSSPAGGAGQDDGLLVGAIGGYAAAVAGVGLMAIFGSMALSEDSALREGCGATRACSPEQVADADTFALVSDIGLGLAVAGAAVGTVLLVLGLTSSGGSEHATLAPWVSPEGGGLTTRLRF